MNEEFDNNSGIDAELQVRLMNLVMGEASDFERDQLQAMMEERAELAAYYQHLEHLHGLLREVGSGEPSLEAEASASGDAWQLPADRREKLLTVLDGKVEEPTTPVRLGSSVSAKLKPYLTRRWLSGLAVAAASLMLGIVIFPRSRLAKEQFLSQRDRALHLSVLHLPEGLDAEASQALTISRRYSQVELDKRTSGITSKSMLLSAEPAPTSSLPSPYYLTDDVQYYPSSRPGAAAAPSVGQPGVQLAAPATNTNGTITFGRSGELKEWAKSSRDRFDRGGQVSMPEIGLSAAGDALPGKPSSSAETDGISSLAGSAGELPGGGGFGGGDSGGMGMGGMAGMGGMGMGGMAGGIPSGMPSSGKDDLGIGGQLGAVEGREFAGREFASGEAANLFMYQGTGSGGTADHKLEIQRQQAAKPGQVDTIDFFDSGVRFGNVDSAESAAGAPNQPTSGGGSNLERKGERLSRSVDLPKSEFGEFDRLDSEVDGETRDLAETTTTVPDGGSIMLGGIIKNRSFAGNDRWSDEYFGVPERPTLLQPVTPQIVIDEEEEARLGVADSPLLSEAELQASERRIIFGKDFGTSIAIVPPQINVRREDEALLSVDGNEPGPVNYPSAEQWEELSVRRRKADDFQDLTRESGNSSGFGEKAQLDSSLLGDVQVEVVDSVGLAIVKGSKQDVQRTLEVIDQVKQQGQPESDVEQAKRAGDAKADISGPESQVNAEWFRKQVGGFQAAGGKDNNQQLAELKKGLELPQDAPVVADFSTPSLETDKKFWGASKDVAPETALQQSKEKIGQIQRGEISHEQVAELRENLNGTIRAQNKGVDESSNRIAMEKALNSENLFSKDTKQSNTINPMPASTESSRQADGYDWAGKEGSKQQGSKQQAPSPEVAAAGRYRLTPAPVAAGTVTDGILADAKPSSEKAAESKAESEPGITEGTERRGRALSKKPAEPSQQELARIATGTALSRSERRPSIDEQSAAKEAFSTFSLHVSDVSFKLAQTALSQGQWPEAAKIRIEEFVNALDYRDPLPTGNEKVACRIEQAIHPFLIQRNMLRVSMRTAATGRSQNTPLRLTVLLDNSGSMERPDRRQAVLRAFQTLSAQLKASDQITLISFASSPRLLADKVPGNQGETLLQLIENLPSEGGTNIESALILAREKAVEQQLAGAQNRIVLLTDGAVNLGNANPDSLAKLVTQMRDSGIAFDAAGISAHDLNDEVLEALTRQGDGRYYLLDSAAAANESFAAQIAGALRPSAQNVKVQVEFNPQRVGRYKLLGFEKHRLNKEDFRNDKVDAAEMAAAEAGVAVYQFEIKPNGTGDVGSVSVRFRDLTTGRMIENRWPIPYESNAPRLEQAEPSMQLAACAALFAAKLSGGPLGDGVDLAQLRSLLAKLPEQVVSQPRVQQLRAMIEQASAIGR